MNVTMTIYKVFKCDDYRLLPEAVLAVVLGDTTLRNQVYHALLAEYGQDIERDWFQQLYEEEFAQRKHEKADFTPPEAAEILAAITGSTGTIHEPTAGSGGLLIKKWHKDMMQCLPWEYFPSQHQINAWERSSRSLPFLLLNVSIRGMMGYVTHGDVLTGEIYQRYAILNRHDDALEFSDVIPVGVNDKIVQKNDV